MHTATFTMQLILFVEMFITVHHAKLFIEMFIALRTMQGCLSRRLLVQSSSSDSSSASSSQVSH